MVARGLANKETAAHPGTASGTIKMHVQNNLARLGAADRNQAVTVPLKRGMGIVPQAPIINRCRAGTPTTMTNSEIDSRPRNVGCRLAMGWNGDCLA